MRPGEPTVRAEAAPRPAENGGTVPTISGMSRSQALPEGLNAAPPPVPSSTPQYYLPSTIAMEQAIRLWERQTGISARGYGGATLMYRPVLLAQVQVRYADRKSEVNTVLPYAFHVPHVPRAGLIHWDEYRAPYVDPRELSHTPFMEAAYGDLSPGLADSRRLTELKREIVDYLYQTASLTIMHNPELDLYAQPGMSRRDFLVQAQTIARQARDEELDRVMRQYDKRFDDLEAKLRKKARELAAEQQQLDTVRNEEMFTAGEAVLSLLRGRTTYTLSRVSRARRYKNYAQEDLAETEQAIAELEAQLDDLHAQMEAALHGIQEKWARAAAVVEDYRITPYKKDIYLDAFGIGWKPHWMIVINGQQQLIPAWGG